MISVLRLWTLPNRVKGTGDIATNKPEISTLLADRRQLPSTRTAECGSASEA